jgi:hypothetical protein
MKTTLNLTTAAVALVLFATSAIILNPATAADRQIKVDPKNIPTSTVDTDAEQPVSVGQVSTESGSTSPAIRRTKEDSFRFRIEDKSQQAAALPALDDEKDATPLPSERPANVLNKQAKLVKKLPPAPIDSNETVDSNQDVTNDDNAADTAADQPETNDEAVADAPEEATMPEVGKSKHRAYYYASKQKSYEHSQVDDASTETVDNDYQQSEEPTYYDYTGASCNHSYNGY